MSSYKFAALPILGLCLAGCGGGGDGIPAGFTTLGTELLAQDAKRQTLSPSITVPTSGIANYSGSLSVGDNLLLVNSQFAVGTANIDVNFTSGTATGSATGFYELGGSLPSARAVPGSVTISATSITGNTIDLGVSGSVNLSNTSTTFVGTVPSQFLGSNADMIFGGGQNLPSSGAATTVDVLILAD